MTKKTANRREAFTLVEMLVVIAIILAIAALAAAFAPRVSDNQNLSRGVDNLEQWLLSAKMRAKRDGLATGLRFVSAQGDAAGTYSQFQYIQQPDALSGGWLSVNQAPNGTSVAYAGLYLNGGILLSAGAGTVSFGNVDFTQGIPTAPNQWLVQTGDYLEVRDGGVYQISTVTAPTTLQLAGTGYDTTLTIATATTNYRILRQPRILIGEEPLTLPNNFAVDTNIIPDSIIPGNSTGSKTPWSNVAAGSSGYIEILFSPTGAVVGANASSGILVISLYDTTMTPFDINRVGIVGVQSRTGFIGAYSAPAGAGLVGYNPFTYVGTGRESGL